MRRRSKHGTLTFIWPAKLAGAVPQVAETKGHPLLDRDDTAGQG